MITKNSTTLETFSYALGLSLMGSLLVGIFFPRLLAFLPSIIALIGCSFFYARHKNIDFLDKKLLIFGVVILALAGISSLWAINSDFALKRTIKLSTIIIPSIFLLGLCTKAIVNKDYRWFIIAIQVIAAIYLIFEEITNHQIVRYFVDYYIIGAFLNRSFVVFAFISLFTLFIVLIMDLSKAKKIALFSALLFLSIITLSFSISQTAQLTFACGLAFLLFFPIRSKLLGKIMFGGILILCFSLPFIIKPFQDLIPQEVLMEGFLKEASIIYRFDVWNFTVTEIMKSPFTGHGIESQRFMKADEWMEHQNADSILHAHNVILQIWIEFGVIGILLTSAFLLYCYQVIFRQENLEIRRLYLMVFAACFSCAMTGYGIWQSWQVGAFFTCAAFAIFIAHTNKNLITLTTTEKSKAR